MPSLILSLLLIPPLLAIALAAGFVIFMIVRYTPIIGRVFEEKPMFLPLRLPPRGEGEEVRFKASDGIDLVGTYLPARSDGRSGVLVFCHEFLSDRWSYQPYADGLRDLGFDVFSFDCRNHGSSGKDPRYQPLQWVSDHEVRDLDAALDYLRSRGDRDPAGFGLMGISRGGGTALVVGSRRPDVWGVVTDGAFPTHGTMFTYIIRWAQIFVGNGLLYTILRDYTPHFVFSLLAGIARRRVERRLGCRFPDIERATYRLSPRAWLMIHGAKDAYIGPDIARALFAEARDPKESWIVPGAKHNRCREVQPAAYAARLEAFFSRNSPRPLATPAPAVGPLATDASLLEPAAAVPPPARADVDSPDESHAIPSPANSHSGGLAPSLSG